MKLDCRMQPLELALLLGFGMIVLPGCGKVQNPHPDARERHGLLFFNYSIDNPMETTSATAVATNTKIYEGLTLRLLVWTNYLPAIVLKGFTDRYGAQVTVAFYDSNDELHDRLARGGTYDIVMPAGFMTQRLIQEGLVHQLDLKRVPNLKNVDPEFRDDLFDPGNRHSVPYLWSTAGIAYNFQHLDHIPHTWADLLTPDSAHVSELSNHVALLPGSVRAIAAALIHLGHSPNSSDPDELEAAGRLLETAMGELHFQFLSGALSSALANEHILMAQAYSSDAERARQHNHHINFTLPEDGVWLTVDHLTIPKAADLPHKMLAETFINYLLDPVVAAKVVNFSFRASTMAEAKAFVESEIKLGPPYSHPSHVLVQTYDREGGTYRRALWDRMTNRFKIWVLP